MDEKYNKAIKSLQPWQKEPIERRISFLESEMRDLIKIITSEDLEDIHKYAFLASFLGFNSQNVCNLSLDALKFLHVHKNELKAKIKAEELLDFSSAFDTFVLLRRREPKNLKELSDLFFFFRNSETGLTLKDLK